MAAFRSLRRLGLGIGSPGPERGSPQASFNCFTDILTSDDAGADVPLADGNGQGEPAAAGRVTKQPHAGRSPRCLANPGSLAVSPARAGNCRLPPRDVWFPSTRPPMADTAQQEPATPQEIWNILREVSAVQQETARRMQETDRQMQETARRIRELNELFNGQWGKLMESLVEGDLVKLLQRRGIAVHHTVTNPRQNYGERRWEFDIVAVNGEEVVVVEVKTTLRVPDVDRFIGRLDEFPELMPEYAGRRIYGAAA